MMLNKKRHGYGLPQTAVVEPSLSNPAGLRELQFRLNPLLKDLKVKNQYLFYALKISETCPFEFYPLLYILLKQDEAMDYKMIISWWDKYSRLAPTVRVNGDEEPAFVLIGSGSTWETRIFYWFMKIEQFLSEINLLKDTRYQRLDNQSRVIEYIGFLKDVPYPKMEEALICNYRKNTSEQDYVSYLSKEVHQLGQIIDIDYLFYFLLYETSWASAFAQEYFRQCLEIANTIKL